ncbi:FAD/NAD(P)-binding oxidoreductase [Fontisubflavum oceani]|uniref:NAD(P)/FAD-dependent oxidoreductase n=1 Tax=Fontisubflavum oceani TaxID=2978973 RepID=UPI0025B33640|nr:FAD/NAD(P)-binding oxidoreductase [Fontisubflavum oceani]WJY21002.1 FAD/NAD(P)-binding oxidoreductase [Fontisubflavum oceani]
MTDQPDFETRRKLLGLMAAGGAVAALPKGEGAQAQTVQSSARIVILGAGAAGTALANRLHNRVDGAQITIIDPRVRHLYQPGFTLIAAGLRPSSYSVSATADWLPRGITWIEGSATNIDAETQQVSTSTGETVGYDYLIVATGLELHYEGIEGMSRDLIGQNGIGSVYAGPEEAATTWSLMDQFTDEGGVGLFTRPNTGMKCAGAPLKYTFLTDDHARRKGTRGQTEIIYCAHSSTLFGVPIVNEKVRMLYERQGFETRYNRVMTAIDPGRKVATFSTEDGGSEEIGFDFTNVIPPMRAHQVIRDSGLSWQTGASGEQGWVEVDQYTLRHTRYDNVFAAGDVAGVPKGKTAASAKWQVAVLEDQLVAQIEGQESDHLYNGYTSCPLITRVGRAMLVEFDYNNNLVPSFPGLIAPLEELWVSWLIKEIGLKATYNAMLRGRA